MEGTLLALSPLDGRYFSKTEPLRKYFSEFALIRFRVEIEIEYLISLTKTGIVDVKPSEELDEYLRQIYLNLTVNDAEVVKNFEKTTNHDVKAVEYFIKERLKLVHPELVPWVHFALTSQDINTSANILQIGRAWQDVMAESLIRVVFLLEELAKSNFNQVMLARTHGQPASPTSLGKELMVFVERIGEQVRNDTNISWKTKFGGATGNFNAHVLSYPDIDWIKLADELCNRFGLVRSLYTTQIDHYDNLSAHFDSYKRINTILIDFCRDIWTYISMDYFQLKIIDNEVGSSAMPHKVNPIDFENAEGNLMLANTLFEFLSRKLPISRLQRDLTDSTVLRNVGVAFGHMLIALNSIFKGVNKLQVNSKAIQTDLQKNWVVIAEGVQNILKREGLADGYERVKDLTRKNQEFSLVMLSEFVSDLPISDEAKETIMDLTPEKYVGHATQFLHDNELSE